MFDVNATAVLVGLLLVMVFAGFHVVAALGIAAVVCLFMVTGDWDIVFFMLGTTAHEALRSYVFAVVPLFMFMGEFIARSGAAADIFNALNRRLRAIPGGLGHATVIGNAIFGFVTGTSLAAATAFTRIAYPEMKRLGYDRLFAHGIIAGSACLGMLIPPSILMIVWGILTEQSIGALFIAGIIPGLLLAALQMIYILCVGIMNPAKVGRSPRAASALGADVTGSGSGSIPESAAVSSGVPSTTGSLLAIVGVIALTLGGIWAGWFTPTEGAGVGAVLGLALGIAKGMRAPQIYDAVLAVGRTAVPIMILLFAAQLYSRVLAMSGVGVAVQDFFSDMGLGPYGTILVMIMIWFVMGMFIDSISIMLLTVPIFAPVATSLGFDPIHFAIIGILVIEAGILTPPFGLLVYGVKAASPEPNISLASLFRATTPYWILLLIEIGLVMMIPALATGLPQMLR